MVAPFVESLSCMKKVFLFKIFTTIQFHDLKIIVFFKHNSELFKSEGCEKHFKAEDYLASHGTII